MTYIIKFFSETKFGCSASDATAGCSVSEMTQTCNCDGETTSKCNTYTMANYYNSAVSISTPIVLVFTMIVSGFAFTS